MPAYRHDAKGGGRCGKLTSPLERVRFRNTQARLFAVPCRAVTLPLRRMLLVECSKRAGMGVADRVDDDDGSSVTLHVIPFAADTRPKLRHDTFRLASVSDAGGLILRLSFVFYSVGVSSNRDIFR